MRHLVGLTHPAHAQSVTSMTTVVADNTDTGGSCSYKASLTDIPLTIYFAAWNGPTPVSQSDIESALAKAADIAPALRRLLNCPNEVRHISQRDLSSLV